MYFFLALFALLLIPTAGILYQYLGSLRDRSLMAPGRLIRIDRSSSLYLLTKGESGPAVVFESGFVATSLNWIHIQEALRDEMRATSYDRCGLGWSSKAASPRTPTSIAAELRQALRAAGLEPPYLLVGHSFGGLVVRRFALEYPADVQGLVLVDPMRTWEWPPYNAPRQSTLERAHRFTRMGLWFARFGAARLAINSLLGGSGNLALSLATLCKGQGLHLHNRLTSEIDKLPHSVRPSICAHWSTPHFYLGLLAHIEGVLPTTLEMHDAHPIRGIPIRVLTPASAERLSADQLARIGDNVEQVIALKSNHWVHFDEPELVIETIRSMQYCSVSAGGIAS